MNAFPQIVAVFIATTLFSIAIGQPNPPHYRARFAGPFASVRPGITGAPFAIEQVAEVVVH
jgi:hypothetical protein